MINKVEKIYSEMQSFNMQNYPIDDSLHPKDLETIKRKQDDLVEMTDRMVRNNIGLHSGYVLVNTNPYDCSKMNGVYTFNFFVNNLDYLGSDTLDQSAHHKRCCVHITNDVKTGEGYIHFKPTVASPFRALKKKIEPLYTSSNSRYEYFMECFAKKYSSVQLADFEQLSNIIGDVVGASGVSTVKEGQELTGMGGKDKLWSFDDFEAKEDSFLFGFKSVSEVDEALPMIQKSWEVADSNPELVKSLVNMRKEMYHMDDLPVTSSNGIFWATQSLEASISEFESKLGLVSKSLNEKDGETAKYVSRYILPSYAKVSEKIRNAIERRNREYVMRFVEFQEKVTDKKSSHDKIIEHISKNA